LEGDVGYIWLFRFHQGTGEEFRRTLQSLMDQGARALVLDLRYNPGGPLRGASGVASQFLSSGIVMYEITNDGKRLDWDIEKGGIARSLPLAVLANEASASSAEVVAGALQDAKRAKVYGNRSYGKGSVQTFQELSNGGALYVTVAHWYTPSGRQIQDYGIEPDVEAFPFRDGAGRTIDLPLALAYSDLLDVVQPLESEKK